MSVKYIYSASSHEREDIYTPQRRLGCGKAGDRNPDYRRPARHNGSWPHELLKSGKNRFVATMMPRAVAAYEKEDGKAYIASMNVGLMGSLFGGEIRTMMARVGRDDAEILQFLAED